jgi:hypothetical protein
MSISLADYSSEDIAKADCAESRRRPILLRLSKRYTYAISCVSQQTVILVAAFINHIADAAKCVSMFEDDGPSCVLYMNANRVTSNRRLLKMEAQSESFSSAVKYLQKCTRELDLEALSGPMNTSPQGEVPRDRGGQRPEPRR